jgi:hypothetical protein
VGKGGSCHLDPGLIENIQEEEMESYRIDRFGSVEGIVLRSGEDPRPEPREILMRVRASFKLLRI